MPRAGCFELDDQFPPFDLPESGRGLEPRARRLRACGDRSGL